MKYTPCYCEENIWNFFDALRQLFPANYVAINDFRDHLLRNFCILLDMNEDFEISSCYVIFISNVEKSVPIWHQKSSPHYNRPVVWDYHVIAAVKTVDSRTLIFDFDTRLSFPSLAKDYISQCLIAADSLDSRYHHRYRIVASTDYLKFLASDRSHMRDANGFYQSPPPSYPFIRTEDARMNLPDFISTLPNWIPSYIVTVEELLLWIDQWIERALSSTHPHLAPSK